ncbi:MULTISPECIES: hypothetical protein [Eikenella]|uniref:Uncharacterized protein n=1 Tax=Eikenella longinqua TaxID=1795827 RepID=A0A1A9RYZ7_9NEIS|nr:MULTISPECIES: hypothetical protein [Eikenella]OAM29950.1 hypothetical protein A7P95_02680 [Eikenella longinqua]
MKIKPEDGSIILPGGHAITAHTTLDNWLALFPESCPHHPQAGITSFGVSFTEQSTQYALTAWFEQQRLARLSLFFCPIGKDTGWEAWSEAHEWQRRKQFEQWLDRQLGDTPCTIHPSAAGQCRRFTWGDAGAYYHPQDGGARIVVNYCR